MDEYKIGDEILISKKVSRERAIIYKGTINGIYEHFINIKNEHGYTESINHKDIDKTILIQKDGENMASKISRDQLLNEVRQHGTGKEAIKAIAEKYGSTSGTIKFYMSTWKILSELRGEEKPEEPAGEGPEEEPKKEEKPKEEEKKDMEKVDLKLTKENIAKQIKDMKPEIINWNAVGKSFGKKGTIVKSFAAKYGLIPKSGRYVPKRNYLKPAALIGVTGFQYEKRDGYYSITMSGVDGTIPISFRNLELFAKELLQLKDQVKYEINKEKAE